MGFDLTHDCQSAFRSLVNAESYPGRIYSLALESQSLTIQSPLPQAFLVAALCLLDIETSFHVESPAAAEAEEFIAQLCGARPQPLGEADFIFVAASDLPLAEVLAGAKPGDLVDPHSGATIIAQVSALAEGGSLILRGPGIKDENRLTISRDREWIAARERKNREFPLGVDLFFVDPEHRVAALPRTTRVKEAT
jgi:alpha-D-ribose 1-methylphosphonate 5-triphosphate synthase subunit PhnH